MIFPFDDEENRGPREVFPQILEYGKMISSFWVKQIYCPTGTNSIQDV